MTTLDITPGADAIRTDAVLSFEDLDVRFGTEFGTVHAVKGISLDVHPGEVVALVGESGSGKSVTSMTALGLLPKNATVSGTVRKEKARVESTGDVTIREDGRASTRNAWR